MEALKINLNFKPIDVIKKDVSKLRLLNEKLEKQGFELYLFQDKATFTITGRRTIKVPKKAQTSIGSLLLWIEDRFKTFYNCDVK